MRTVSPWLMSLTLAAAAAVTVPAAGVPAAGVPVDGQSVMVRTGQARTAPAAMAAAKELANCRGCRFTFASDRPQRSARRGLVAIGVGDGGGGGYVMLMGHTGSRWARLWEGNGSTRNLDQLPGRVAICMDRGGWTNLRSGPGQQHARVARVTRPTLVKALELRLTKPLGATEGVAWYRIRFNNRTVWVQNLRTVAPYQTTAAGACREWGWR